MPDITLYENTTIIEAFKNKVLIDSDKEIEGIPFFATGRRPNSEIVDGFVELNPNKSIKVNEMMQTSVENVYVAGNGREIGRASLGKECRSRWSPYH